MLTSKILEELWKIRYVLHSSMLLLRNRRPIAFPGRFWSLQVESARTSIPRRNKSALVNERQNERDPRSSQWMVAYGLFHGHSAPKQTSKIVSVEASGDDNDNEDVNRH